MPKYDGNAAYDLDLFAPSPKKKKKKVQRVQTPKKQEPVIDLRQAVKIIFVAAVVLTMVATMINGRVQLNEVRSDITRIEKNIKVADSEKIRLTMELNSMMSLDAVEDYAINVLGMQKIQNYQIEYIDISAGNRFEFNNEDNRQKEMQDVNEKLKVVFGWSEGTED